MGSSLRGAPDIETRCRGAVPAACAAFGAPPGVTLPKG